MSRSRGGRRRRVLNEEVLSASAMHQAYRPDASASDASGESSRYGETVTQDPTTLLSLVPIRPRWFVLLAFVGIVVLAGLMAAHIYRDHLAVAAGLADSSALTVLDMTAPTSIATWAAAIGIAGMAWLCLLIYSLRRHRIDDYRGRYRVWLWAAGVCLLFSANGVTHLHALTARILAAATGWTALPGGAAWWLLLGGPPLLWIGYRAVSDLWESRLSRVAALAACLVSAVALGLSFYPVRPAAFTRLLPDADLVFSAAAAMAAGMLWCFALVSYARHVALEIQGMAPAAPSRPRRASNRKQAKKQQRPEADSTSSETKETAATIPMNTATAKEQQAAGDRGAPSPQHAAAVRQAAAKTPSLKKQDAAQWVDGSQPEREWVDEDEMQSSGRRKLSKSERKRLRKLKAQQRAA